MTTRDSLLKAICANPLCDTVRLAYADYLQENGDDTEAAFVRIQVQIAETGTGNTDLLNRDRKLLQEIRTRVRTRLPTPTVPAHGSDIEWGVCSARHFDDFAEDDFLLGTARGFVSQVACPGDTWLQLADRLYWHPDLKVCCSCRVLDLIGSGWRCDYCEGRYWVHPQFVNTAQPITHVVLSSLPSRVNFDNDFHVFRFLGRRFHPLLDLTFSPRSIDEIVQRLLEAEWPQIRFSLPERPLPLLLETADVEG